MNVKKNIFHLKNMCHSQNWQRMPNATIKLKWIKKWKDARWEHKYGHELKWQKTVAAKKYVHICVISWKICEYFFSVCFDVSWATLLIKLFECHLPGTFFFEWLVFLNKNLVLDNYFYHTNELKALNKSSIRLNFFTRLNHLILKIGLI